MWSVAWMCAITGLGLGAMASLVPGFPGSAVALLGLVCFAGLTDFTVLGEEALVLATVIAIFASVGQIAGPAVGSRSMGGTAGVATGAALGAVIGTFIPVPGAAWVCAVLLGAGLGIVATRKSVLSWLRGVVGAAGGCCVSAGIDFLAVLALGGILAISDYMAIAGFLPK